MLQQKTRLADDLQDKVYLKFLSLPLESKLVVYARLVHGNMFKAQNNDLFGLNRRTVSKIYRGFIESVGEDYADKRSPENRTKSRQKK